MKKMNALMIAAALSISVTGISAAGSCGSTSSAGNQVMMTAASTDAKTAEAQPKSMDIVQTAIGAGSFKTLVAAVQAAGLVETLQGKGPSPSSPRPMRRSRSCRRGRSRIS